MKTKAETVTIAVEGEYLVYNQPPALASAFARSWDVAVRRVLGDVLKTRLELPHFSLASVELITGCNNARARIEKFKGDIKNSGNLFRFHPKYLLLGAYLQYREIAFARSSW
jgi:hypothetical protein